MRCEPLDGRMGPVQVDLALVHAGLEPGRDGTVELRGLSQRPWCLGQVNLHNSVLAYGGTIRPERVLNEPSHFHPGAYGGPDRREFPGHLVDLYGLLGEHGSGALLSLGDIVPLPEELLFLGLYELLEPGQVLLNAA